MTCVQLRHCSATHPYKPICLRTCASGQHFTCFAGLEPDLNPLQSVDRSQMSQYCLLSGQFDQPLFRFKSLDHLAPLHCLHYCDHRSQWNCDYRTVCLRSILGTLQRCLNLVTRARHAFWTCFAYFELYLSVTARPRMVSSILWVRSWVQIEHRKVFSNSTTMEQAIAM